MMKWQFTLFIPHGLCDMLIFALWLHIWSPLPLKSVEKSFPSCNKLAKSKSFCPGMILKRSLLPALIIVMHYISGSDWLPSLEFNLSKMQLPIIPELPALHWLPVCHKTDFKIIFLFLKHFSGLAPLHFSYLLHSYSPSQTPRWVDQLLLAFPKFEGDQVLAAAVLKLWNKAGSFTFVFYFLFNAHLFYTWHSMRHYSFHWELYCCCIV